MRNSQLLTYRVVARRADSETTTDDRLLAVRDVSLLPVSRATRDPPAVCKAVAELGDALVLVLHVLDEDLRVVDVVDVLIAVKRHLQLQG